MKKSILAVALIAAMILCLVGCGEEKTETPSTTATTTTTAGTTKAVTFNPASVGFYTGDPYKKLHGNKPYFTDAEITDQSFVSFADLDALGRVGVATASVCKDSLAADLGGDGGSDKPTGWHTNKYDTIDGKYLFVRTNLIGGGLANTADAKNVFTGTRYMQTEGIAPFEQQVTDYLKTSNNHVMYRVTPVFEGENLVAKGVLLEAISVEDNGKGLCFCVFCFNVQPGITINYATGDNEVTKSTRAVSDLYMVDKLQMVFHLPSCGEVPKISATQVYGMTEPRETLIEQGYKPCDKCHP